MVCHLISFFFYYYYAIASPLLMLSKCSFALMRNVAIEFDRISVLFMVIFNAISLPETWFMSTLLSLSSNGFLSFGLCGDDEFDDSIRELFDADGNRLTAFWFGDNERFCGDDTVGKLLCTEVAGDEDAASDMGMDVISGGGNDIWLGGVWRCPTIICAAIDGPFRLCCGDDKRIFCGCIAAILCGEMRKLDAFPWCDKPRLDIAIFDGAKLSGGVK